jgi:Fic family protein
MKMPATPPDFRRLIRQNPHFFEKTAPLLEQPAPQDHIHWDKLRRLPAPEGLTHAEWWAALKISRLPQMKAVPLLDAADNPFQFMLTDAVARQLHEIDLGTGWNLAMPDALTNPHTKDQYTIGSLMHEAITSSQLEGAVTTRDVAKEMLRAGRPPRDKSERMILNNYKTMQRIVALKHMALTPDLVFEIHQLVTDDTLDNPAAAGRLRRADEQITVEDDTGEVFHTPPPADSLPARMTAMCAFANGHLPDTFIHPAIRAIILHFWLGYDHPFVDGNGLTARALFYWAMLRQNYSLFEFISISDILRKAPAAYYRAFLYTETDANDLTYFIAHQTEVIRRAIENLHARISRKTSTLKEGESLLRNWHTLNHRQVALITHALRHPGTIYTIEAHQNSHRSAYDTARRDLLSLAELGLLTKGKRGRAMIFRATPDLTDRITQHQAS